MKFLAASALLLCSVFGSGEGIPDSLARIQKGQLKAEYEEEKREYIERIKHLMAEETYDIDAEIYATNNKARKKFLKAYKNEVEQPYIVELERVERHWNPEFLSEDEEVDVEDEVEVEDEDEVEEEEDVEDEEDVEGEEDVEDEDQIEDEIEEGDNLPLEKIKAEWTQAVKDVLNNKKMNENQKEGALEKIQKAQKSKMIRKIQQGELTDEELEDIVQFDEDLDQFIANATY